MRLLALTLLLAGCGGSVQTCSDSHVVVPEELKRCPSAPAAVPVPTLPRSFDSVVAWANATDQQRLATVAALRECSVRLERLVALVGK